MDALLDNVASGILHIGQQDDGCILGQGILVVHKGSKAVQRRLSRRPRCPGGAGLSRTARRACGTRGSSRAVYLCTTLDFPLC